MLSSTSISSLQTGDVLLFSGKGLSSEVIRWFTGSYWTHVGVIVRLDELDEPILLESNLGPASVDLISGEAQSGVSLVQVERKLSDYQGEIAIRRRQGEPLTLRQRRLVRRLVKRLYRRPYRHYLWRQVIDRLPGVRRRDYSAMFCSELVAELYRRLGWLPEDVRCGGFFPGHFAAESFVLQQGVLQPPEWLKRCGEYHISSARQKKSDLAVAGC
ncbi:hypothetical protein [Alcanivorax sp. 1008]|uniref:hypothetical protein n=1 Tax=Alcanivorax sp. 1008 TaxID=2816853 RepID=UPI001E16D987|nr:hypothetical protein [Alcanivorax sp. 1008]MCC1496517.1 hypothetical protein [Alcanivorax sp. 1008]